MVSVVYEATAGQQQVDKEVRVTLTKACLPGQQLALPVVLATR